MTSINRGLIIRSPWVEKIMDGEKTWEIRGGNTHIRGPVALIRSLAGKPGKPMVVGVANLVDVKGPLSLPEMKAGVDKHRIPLTELEKNGLPYVNRKTGESSTWAWVFKDARRLATPVPYRHKPGTVIWATLDDAAQRKIGTQLDRIA